MYFLKDGRNHSTFTLLVGMISVIRGRLMMQLREGRRTRAAFFPARGRGVSTQVRAVRRAETCLLMITETLRQRECASPFGWSVFSVQ